MQSMKGWHQRRPQLGETRRTKSRKREEDLAALRSAVLASMLQPKAAVIPKEEARPLAPMKSDSEDDEDDLAALRAAALQSKRKKSLESSQDSRRNSSDKFSSRRSGSNGTANLITIPPQNVESVKSLPARSQNRWGGSLNSSPASTPTKSNVGHKFSRLQHSDTESEESDQEPVTTDTKKSDDELGSDVDIHLGFDAKEIPTLSPALEEPSRCPGPVHVPAQVPIDVAVPVAVPEEHVLSPVRVKTEPQDMDDKSMVYRDIDERTYNHRRLNDFGNTYTDPVVIDEHGDVDMRRVESHLKPPKLQIQVNMDGAGDRRRVQVADVGPVQQMFRVTVTNLNQQRNILLEGADGCLFHDGMGMQLGGRLRPIDDLSVLDARRMIMPRLEQERPKPLVDGEQYGNSGYWDTAEQFRKRKQSYEGQETPWNDVNNYQTANKAIETDHYLAEKTTGKLYMDRESSKFVDREEKPKLRLTQPDHYSDSDSKTDSLLPAESVSTREHDIAVNAEYWVTADQTTERVVKRGGKVKLKSGEKTVKRKSRSPRAEKVKTSKDSRNRSRTSKKRQPEPESSLERYSGDESEITTSRDIKRERDDSFSESEHLSSRERSPSESDVKNSDTIDDDSKFSDIYSEDVSSVSHKANRPVLKKKNRGPQPPVRTHQNSGRSPKQVVVNPKKDKSPRGRKEVVNEHVKNVKGRRARHEVEEFDRSESRERGEGHVKEHNHHVREKNIRHKGDVDEKVHRTKNERVRKSKMVYEEEEDDEEIQAKPKKSRAAREVSDEESSPERPVKTKRSVKDVAGVTHHKAVKKKMVEAPVERSSRPKQRSPRKKLTPEPVEPKRSPGNRMYRSRKLPEEEGEITDEESEERVCKPVKLRSKEQLKMREAIGECSRKLHELLRREEKEEGELDESPVEVNRRALKGLKEEKEEGELSEGPSERKRKVTKGQKLAAPDSDEEERLASRKLQKLRKDKVKSGAEPGDKVVAEKKAKSKSATSEEQSAEKVVEKKTTVGSKLKPPEEVEKSKTGKEISSEKFESGDKNDSDTSAKSNKSKRSLEGTAAKSDVGTNVTSATEKMSGQEEKKSGEKAAKRVESGKAAKGKKTDDEESGAKWKKVGEGEEDRALSPLQEMLEEANKEVEDATKQAAAAEEKDKTAAARFKKFQLEKPGVKKGAKSEEEVKTKAAATKKPTEPKKLDKAGLKLSETKEKLLKILAQGKLKTQDAAKKTAGKPGQKDDTMNFSAGLEAIVQRKGADSRKKVTATKAVKKSVAKRKKNISKSPVRKKSKKSNRGRHRDSRSRSSSTTSYSDRRKSRHRRRHRYSSTESSRSRYSSTSYSRRSRSRSRRRSYSRRRSRSRSSSYSHRRSRSRSRRRSRSRKRSSSGSRSSSRTRSSSRSGSTSSTRSSSHSRSTRSSSTGSTSSTSSASSKDSNDNAAWRFKHTGTSAKAGQTKSEIFERKRTDIENEQKKKQNKNTIDKELPDDRRGNYNNRNDDRPWRGGHDFRYNNNNRGRFTHHDNRPRFNDFGNFRGPGRYQRDWYPRGSGSGYRDFRDHRQDNNFRDFRNQNRDRPPFVRRNRSWSSERGNEKDASPERSRSKDKKGKSQRSKSRDDSKDTENKRSRSRESGAQTKTAGAIKSKVNPPPKFDADKEKVHSDSEGSQQGENKRDKEKLPVHKRLGSQLGNVIPAKMNRRQPDNEPDMLYNQTNRWRAFLRRMGKGTCTCHLAQDNYRGQQRGGYVYRRWQPRGWHYQPRWHHPEFSP
ncbi:serine/arginine repetitive matrix protein 2-like isoform X3 [Lineus longissimus]|uniref:serine/arginine repetitive matrix protein 2-like isoform X3 n=1 Tax=Lineus longissimus TaxID=88925 RepID=UPI002B4EDE72